MFIKAMFHSHTMKISFIVSTDEPHRLPKEKELQKDVMGRICVGDQIAKNLLLQGGARPATALIEPLLVTVCMLGAFLALQQHAAIVRCGTQGELRRMSVDAVRLGGVPNWQQSADVLGGDGSTGGAEKMSTYEEDETSVPTVLTRMLPVWWNASQLNMDGFLQEPSWKKRSRVILFSDEDIFDICSFLFWASSCENVQYQSDETLKFMKNALNREQRQLDIIAKPEYRAYPQRTLRGVMAQQASGETTTIGLFMKVIRRKHTAYLDYNYFTFVAFGAAFQHLLDQRKLPLTKLPDFLHYLIPTEHLSAFDDVSPHSANELFALFPAFSVLPNTAKRVDNRFLDTTMDHFLLRNPYLHQLEEHGGEYETEEQGYLSSYRERATSPPADLYEKEGLLSLMLAIECPLLQRFYASFEGLQKKVSPVKFKDSYEFASDLTEPAYLTKIINESISKILMKDTAGYLEELSTCLRTDRTRVVLQMLRMPSPSAADMPSSSQQKRAAAVVEHAGAERAAMVRAWWSALLLLLELAFLPLMLRAIFEISRERQCRVWVCFYR